MNLLLEDMVFSFYIFTIFYPSNILEAYSEQERSNIYVQFCQVYPNYSQNHMIGNPECSVSTELGKILIKNELVIIANYLGFWWLYGFCP
jgi:hypothetical protein